MANEKYIIDLINNGESQLRYITNKTLRDFIEKLIELKENYHFNYIFSQRWNINMYEKMLDNSDGECYYDDIIRDFNIFEILTTLGYDKKEIELLELFDILITKYDLEKDAYLVVLNLLKDTIGGIIDIDEDNILDQELYLEIHNAIIEEQKQEKKPYQNLNHFYGFLQNKKYHIYGLHELKNNILKILLRSYVKNNIKITDNPEIINYIKLYDLINSNTELLDIIENTNLDIKEPVID
jgi:hypothetical protein